MHFFVKHGMNYQELFTFAEIDLVGVRPVQHVEHALLGIPLSC